MMKKLVFSLLIGVALLSCSEPMNDNDNVIKVNIEDARPMELAELVESIEIIPLETNDSCLVGEHHSMQVRNGIVYITNEQKEVLKFDAKGKFLRSTLPHRGQRTDEYIIAYSSFVDEEDNLEIYEMYLPRIQKYTKEFDYLETIQVEVPNTLSTLRARTHAKLNDSIYIFKDVYDIHFYSITEKRTIKTLHEDVPPLLGQTTQLMMVDYDNKWHYSRSYSCDTLFYLDEKELTFKPELIFDFGGKSFNVNDMPADMPIEYYQKYLVETDKLLVLEKINLSDRKYCFFLEGENSYVSCTSKKGTKVYKQSKKNQLPTPHAIKNNIFYNLVWPEKLENYIQSELMDKESLNRIQQVKDDDNPVLVCYRLKK